MKNVEAKINVRGGEVSKVSILSTGGTLENKVLLDWQQSITPQKAVMIDMKLVPISLLMTNPVAKAHLQEYLETVGKLTDEEETPDA